VESLLERFDQWITPGRPQHPNARDLSWLLRHAGQRRGEVSQNEEDSREER
jgi:hypothetical protein